MKISIHHKSPDYNTYRVARVKSLFNADGANEFKLEAELPIEDEEWQIGLVVGPSGSGKTSIGRELFGGGKILDLYQGWDTDKAIVECIAPEGDFNAVTGALAAVGLGDVPSWKKSFHALSNGQQFRAGLARVICEDDPEVVIDEFTSVVDRQIAKIGAMAFSKNWRKTKGRKVVLLACHYDIIEWLQPDWVFDTGTGKFQKKKTSENGLLSNSSFGRSTALTGSILSRITI